MPTLLWKRSKMCVRASSRADTPPLQPHLTYLYIYAFLILVMTVLYTGWHRNTQNIPPCTIGHRCRRSRRDRRRASPARHQRLDHDDARYARLGATLLPTRPLRPPIRHPAISRRRLARNDAREPPDRLLPPGRAQSVARLG